MDRKPTHTPADPWQWFSGCLYHLGDSRLLKTWNVSRRTLEKWSADRRTTQSVSKNPLVLLGETLETLMVRGHADFAISAVDYLAEICRCHIEMDQANIVADKATLEEELLDNYEVIAEYTAAMRDPGVSNREKREKARKAIEEIQQDLTLLDD